MKHIKPYKPLVIAIKCSQKLFAQPTTLNPTPAQTYPAVHRAFGCGHPLLQGAQGRLPFLRSISDLGLGFEGLGVEQVERSTESRGVGVYFRVHSEFPKIRVPYFGVRKIRILLFRVLY